MSDSEFHFDAESLTTTVQVHPADPNAEYVSFNTASDWAWEHERIGPEVLLAHIIEGQISLAMRKSKRGKLRIVLNADDVCMCLARCAGSTRVVLPGAIQSAQ